MKGLQERLSYLAAWAHMEKLELTHELRKIAENAVPAQLDPKDAAFTVSRPNWTLTFREEKRTDLEAWVVKAEDARGLAHYCSVAVSPLLQALVDRWHAAGRRRQLKDLADLAVSCNDFSAVNGMRLLAELRPGPTVWVAQLPQCMVCFIAGTEEEAVSRLGEPGARETKAVPSRTVAVRMAALRMRKILESVRYHNKRVAECNEHWPDRVHPAMIKEPDLASAKEVADFMGRYGHGGEGSYIWSGCDWRKLARYVMDALERPGMDDSVVRDAWHVVVAEEVVSS